MQLATPRFVPILGLMVAAAIATPSARLKPIAVYNAQAVNLDAPTGLATGPVQIQITRWSTDAERDMLRTALFEKGQTKLVDVMSKLEPVGTIRTPDSVGYDLRYARRTTAGGNEQVVVVTDRPMGFWERRNVTRSTEYPFTVVELRLRPGGEGDGKLSIATKVMANKANGEIELENYNIGPVLLKNVKKDND